MVAMVTLTITKNTAHLRRIGNRLGCIRWYVTIPKQPQQRIRHSDNRYVHKKTPASKTNARFPMIGTTATMYGCSTSRIGKFSDGEHDDDTSIDIKVLFEFLFTIL